MVYTIDHFAQADLKEVLEQLNLDEKVSLLAVRVEFLFGCRDH